MSLNDVSWLFLPLHVAHSQLAGLICLELLLWHSFSLDSHTFYVVHNWVNQLYVSDTEGKYDYPSHQSPWWKLLQLDQEFNSSIIFNLYHACKIWKITFSRLYCPETLHTHITMEYTGLNTLSWLICLFINYFPHLITFIFEKNYISFIFYELWLTLLLHSWYSLIIKLT